MPALAPSPTRPAAPGQTVDPEALIQEARDRQRRRRRRSCAIVIAVAIVAVVGIVGIREESSAAPAIEHVRGGPVVNIAAFAGHGHLAFISRNTVWVVDGERKSLRRIHTTPGLYPLQPEFSPDGRWLAFVDTRTQPAYVAGGGGQPGQLWLARGDGTDAHPVAGLANALLVGWSSTSDVLAVLGGPISKRVPFGSETTVRLVTATGVRQLLRARSVNGAVWSPDGHRLAVVTQDGRLHETLASYPAGGGPRTIWKRFAPHTHLNGMSQILVHPAGWWQGFGIGLWIFGDGMTHNNDAGPLDVVSGPGAEPRYLADTLSDETTRVTAGGVKAVAVVADVSHGINGGRVVWDAKQLQICTPTGVCKPVSADRGVVTLDPAWSPNGRQLAFVEAPDLNSSGWRQSVLKRWYADHQLRLFDRRTHTIRTLAAEQGATVPVWSADGKSLLYVSGDGIWLVRRQGGKPVEIARPLFRRSLWPAYYGQMAWPAQFAWSSR